MITQYSKLSKDEFVRRLDWEASSNQQIGKETVCLSAELVLEAIQRIRGYALESELKELARSNQDLENEIEELERELETCKEELEK